MVFISVGNPAVIALLLLHRVFCQSPKKEEVRRKKKSERIERIVLTTIVERQRQCFIREKCVEED